MSTSTRIRITSDRVNSYGCRVLTSGIDIEQYQRNPVLLWMHNRGDVIGHLENIEIEDDGITADVVFDEVSERSKQVAAQWEAESLRMVSAGLEILEVSDDLSLLAEGQSRPTITRSKLLEVSVVDIGSNDDAIRLSHEGTIVNLSEGGEAVLPLLNDINTSNDMTLRGQIIETLGLDTTSSDADIVTNIKLLCALEDDYTALLKKHDELLCESVTAEVDGLIQKGTLQADGREAFIRLGMQDREALGLIVKHVRPAHASVIDAINHASSERATSDLKAEWDTLDRQGLLFDLKNNDPERFRQLFEARFPNE